MDALASDCGGEVAFKPPPLVDVSKIRKKKKKLRKPVAVSATGLSSSLAEDSAMEVEDVVAAVKARKRRSEELAKSSSPDLGGKKGFVQVEPVDGGVVVPVGDVPLVDISAAAGAVSLDAGATLVKIGAAPVKVGGSPVVVEVPLKVPQLVGAAIALPKKAEFLKKSDAGKVSVDLNLDGVLLRCNSIKKEVVGLLSEFSELGGRLAEVAGRYESLILELSGTNERLRGKLDVVGGQAVTPRVGGVAKSLGVPVGVEGAERPSFPQVELAKGIEVSDGRVGRTGVKLPDVQPPKPVETWSLIVKGKKNESVKEVKKRVVEDLVPAVGVREFAGTKGR